MSDDRSIWDLLAEAAETLPQPFSRAALVTWVSARRPDVALSSIGTHIQYAIADAPNRSSHPLGRRTPFLERVDRGLYRRLDPFGALRTAQESAGQPNASDVVRATPAHQPTSRIVLVGCSQTKAPAAAPARDLFVGPLFRKARLYAERSGAPWYVLSAKFGLLDPDEVVSPYDVYLGNCSVQYRSAWGGWVVAQLAEREQLSGAVVEVHAGRTYCAPLEKALAEAGVRLEQPLAGLSQGKQLAWYGSVGVQAEPDEVPSPVLLDVAWLLDGRNAVSPDAFLAAGRTGSDEPGLYSWWVDADGAQALSAGLGHEVAPGLVYAGRAGGRRHSGKLSTNTLWGRLATMHLGGNREFSTFRLTLAAVLQAAGEPVDEEAALTAWMGRHLKVAMLPLPADEVFPAELRLLQLADPPLNLRDMPKTPLRQRLSQLRSELGRS